MTQQYVSKLHTQSEGENWSQILMKCVAAVLLLLLFCRLKELRHVNAKDIASGSSQNANEGKTKK